VSQIHKAGGEASYVVADVASPRDVEAIAEHAVEKYGGFDTWINDAGVGIYGRLTETPISDARRLFDTNYWGTVHGSLVAAEYLRERGGAIINIGSIESDVAIPLHGHYSASKHAIKGFTETLRLELEKDEVPVVVTLVKPAAMDTPFTLNTRNLMDRAPDLPAPVYAPRVAARAILRCAVRPVREITVGGGGRMITAMSDAAPRLTDRYLEATMFSELKKPDGSAHPRRRDTLHRTHRHGAHERGDHEGHVSHTSAYTAARLHPLRALLAAGVLAAGVTAAVRAGNGGG
jgi:short-subunit dehydrogenase